ncbi:MAG: ABC transporter ATP-binding protein [Lachnospiraceae bacterium]|nr:ABC transporter ATP-binding protein [Lachnospiraceae bacterium]
MKTVILQAKGLNKSFSAFGNRKTQVLKSIDLEIEQGDFTVIMGASGAGKSTLLYTLSGMDSISQGEVFYKNEKLTNLSEKKMARLRAKEFGFVFQQTHLVSNLTLFENVKLAGYLAGEKQAEEKAKELLTQMGVEEVMDHMPHQVSGGEGQRAAIARAIIGSPGVLFADEPTGALNKKSSEEILNIFTALHQKGQSILMVTHDLRAALRGNRILYLEDGQILSERRFPPYDAKQDQKAREAQLNERLSSLSW